MLNDPADALDVLRGRVGMPGGRRPRPLMSIIGTHNVVYGQAINYELGYATDGSTILLMMMATDRDGFIVSFESNDIYALYRLCEFFGRVNIRPVEENVAAFFKLLSREEELDLEDSLDPSDDILELIASLLTEKIPESIVQFVVENPGIVPPFLTTEEIEAGTIEWEEAMAEAGILTPEQVRDLYSQIAQLIQVYQDQLARFAAATGYVMAGEDHEVAITRTLKRYDQLVVTFLIGYEYLKEDERSTELVLFLALVLFMNQRLGVSKNLLTRALVLYAPLIVAWLREIGVPCDQETLVTQALEVVARMTMKRKEIILLYDSRTG